MKLNVALPGNHHIPGTPEWSWRLSPADWRRVATTVDQLGYDALSTSEHLAMPYEEVPRLGPYWLHALSVMAFVAGTTDRVRIDTSVLVLPYHQPLDLAKALSTIDVLSAGRLNVSVGVGHAEREFEALGVPFTERGARSDEILAAMKELWSADEPAFHGRFYDIEGLAFEPKPVQKPRPPIYVGGNSEAALRRAARHEGWMCNPSRMAFDDVHPILDYLRGRPELAGKPDFDLFWLPSPDMWEGPAGFGGASAAVRDGYRERLLGWFAELAGLGMTRNTLPLAPTGTLEEYLDYLHWFDQEVAPQMDRS
jgi:probable F420-dependent oxidoreductase